MNKTNELFTNLAAIRCKTHNNKATFICRARNCEENRFMCSSCSHKHTKFHSTDIESVAQVFAPNKRQEIDETASRLLKMYLDQEKLIAQEFTTQMNSVWSKILPSQEELQGGSLRTPGTSAEQKLLEEQNQALKNLERYWSMLYSATDDNEESLVGPLFQKFLDSYVTVNSLSDKISQHLGAKQKSGVSNAALSQASGVNVERFKSLIDLKVEDYIHDFLETLEASKPECEGLITQTPSKPMKTPSTKAGTDPRSKMINESSDDEVRIVSSTKKNQILREPERHGRVDMDEEEDSAPSIISNHSYDIIRELEEEWRLLDNPPRDASNRTGFKRSEALSIESSIKSGMDADSCDHLMYEDSKADILAYERGSDSDRPIGKTTTNRGRPRKNENNNKNEEQSNSIPVRFLC